MRLPFRRLRHAAIFEQLGPGLVTGAADDDPSGIATYSQAGAQFGFGMLWTLPLTYPLMAAIQLLSAEVGRVTGAGLARNMGEVLPRWLVTALVALLFVANTINVGADLAAMGEAASLMLGPHTRAFTLAFVVLTLGLQLFVPYHRYVVFLKWLTMALLAYVAVVFSIKLDWGKVAHGLVVPDFKLGKESFKMVFALFW